MNLFLGHLNLTNASRNPNRTLQSVESLDMKKRTFNFHSFNMGTESIFHNLANSMDAAAIKFINMYLLDIHSSPSNQHIKKMEKITVLERILDISHDVLLAKIA